MFGLGRIPQFDKRSLDYPVSTLIPSDVIRGRSFYCPAWLNQGNTSACVGFSWAHELAAYPYPIPSDNGTGLLLYKHAQLLDEWPGEDYDGSSVLGGAKAVRERGYIREYRWCFGVSDVLSALSHIGPVIFGTPWLESMFDPRPSGLLEVDFGSGVAGGHAYLARGLLLKPRIGEPNLGPVIRFRNSWSRSWGRDGDFFIKVEDAERLLKSTGEACCPIGRSYGP